MTQRKVYYFDNNATTRIAPEVVDAMVRFANLNAYERTLCAVTARNVIRRLEADDALRQRNLPLLSRLFG